MTPPPVFPMIGSDQETDAGKNEMPLLRYASRCARISMELQSELSESEYKAVPEALSHFSLADWYIWRGVRSELIADIATAPPARRRKILHALDPKEKLLFVFAACQYCIEAKYILLAVDEHCQPGIPYRDMMRSAHLVVDAHQSELNSLWPWRGAPTFQD